jgi:hypothetical protein
MKILINQIPKSNLEEDLRPIVPYSGAETLKIQMYTTPSLSHPLRLWRQRRTRGVNANKARKQPGESTHGPGMVTTPGCDDGEVRAAKRRYRDSSCWTHRFRFMDLMCTATDATDIASSSSQHQSLSSTTTLNSFSHPRSCLDSFSTLPGVEGSKFVR